MRPLSLGASTLALSLLAASPARAEWKVQSEFQLHLTESTFDKIIQDFWSTLQGTKTIPVGNMPVNLGDTQLEINGINVAVNYDFPVPSRVDTTHRIWELKSNKLSANVTVSPVFFRDAAMACVSFFWRDSGRSRTSPMTLNTMLFLMIASSLESM